MKKTTLLLLFFFLLQPALRAEKNAVLFVRDMYNMRQNNLIRYTDSLSYNQYQKLNVGFIGLTEQEKNFVIFRYFNFLFENSDHSEINGSPIQFLVSRELNERVTFHKNSVSTNLLAIENDWVDALLEEKGVNMIVNEAFNNIDFYEPNFPFLMGLNFVSPISKSKTIEPYVYQLTDTVMPNSQVLKKLSFTPRLHNTNGFSGFFLVHPQAPHPICQIRCSVSGDRNLNFLDKATIAMDYSFDPNTQAWLLNRKEISLELSLFKVFVRLTSFYSDYTYTPAQKGNEENTLLSDVEDKIYRGELIQKVHTDRAAHNRSKEYWEEVRPIPLSKQESISREHFSEMISAETKGSPGFKIITDLILSNAVSVPGFEFTPILSTVSRNSVEGVRLRLGGRTTHRFSKNLFLDGYMAYGIKDEKLKFYAAAEYSIPKKKLASEFPIHSLKLSVIDDVKQFSETNTMSIYKDNALESFRQSALDKMIDIKAFELRYKQEFQSGLSVMLSLNSRRERAAGSWSFEGMQNFASSSNGNLLKTSEAKIAIRFAPNERYYQRTSSRLYYNRFTPTITLSHTFGLNGFLGGEYNYNHTEITTTQTNRFGIFGNLQSSLSLGKIWDRVPYPLLIKPASSGSYLISRGKFSLMNELEFVADSYISLDLEHHFQGLLFNLFPFNRWLKFREVVGFKAILGTLSEQNYPFKQSIYTPEWAPQWATKDFESYSFRHGIPYMECSVGIENILQFLRFDYVWRLTYLDRPHINHSGFRIGLNLRF